MSAGNSKCGTENARERSENVKWRMENEEFTATRHEKIRNVSSFIIYYLFSIFSLNRKGTKKIRQILWLRKENHRLTQTSHPKSERHRRINTEKLTVEKKRIFMVKKGRKEVSSTEYRAYGHACLSERSEEESKNLYLDRMNRIKTDRTVKKKAGIKLTIKNLQSSILNFFSVFSAFLRPFRYTPLCWALNDRRHSATSFFARNSELETRNSKLTVLVLIVSLVSLFFSGRAFAGQYASDTWAQLTKYVAVQPGDKSAVWENNALITNGLLQMTPRGDGTYEGTVPLNAGSTYNFLFFAKTGANPPDGLQANYTYYDCVPGGGNIQSGTTPFEVTQYDSTQTAPVRYGAIGDNWDARRVIAVPSYLNPGDSFFVYGNFSDKPGKVTSFKATAMDTTSVRLVWSYPYGYWGSSGENYKAADVLAGGTYAIYRNTTGSTTAYTKIASVSGNTFRYMDTGLTPGTTYYYTIASIDAYTGKYDTQPFKQLASDTDFSDSATPDTPIQVFFKVEGIDWDYVSAHHYIVYMTPGWEKNKYFARRIPAAIMRVYVGE